MGTPLKAAPAPHGLLRIPGDLANKSPCGPGDIDSFARWAFDRLALDQTPSTGAPLGSLVLEEAAMLIVYEFDPAIYLNDEAAIEAYLESARKGGDPAEIEAAETVAKAARERLATLHGPETA